MKIVMDIDTQRMTPGFRDSWDIEYRFKHAPAIDLLGLYFVEESEFKIYSADECIEVMDVIKSADELITFNGERFDLLVLSKACAMTQPVDLQRIHTDLRQEIYNDRYGWMGLIEAYQYFVKSDINRVNGPEEQLYSDVKLTFELWKYYVAENRQFS